MQIVWMNRRMRPIKTDMVLAAERWDRKKMRLRLLILSQTWRFEAHGAPSEFHQSLSAEKGTLSTPTA